jgi:hypothetical protein
MFPPLPVYTRGVQIGSGSPFYEQNDNKNKVAVNATTTKPEANTYSQTDEEAGGASEISKNCKDCKGRYTWAYIGLVISLTISAIWAFALWPRDEHQQTPPPT